MNTVLGCIADDFTGATDLANTLVRGGMRVVQTIGVPSGPPAAGGDVDAVVVALKSRTIPAAEAVRQSLQAAEWLASLGVRQQFFKVCSTFDSTPQGNIGPVMEALARRLGESLCVVTPAFPENGRTVFRGHLFVGDLLLADSSMRDHPLTPMTDANLVRVLQAQLDPTGGGKVGLLAHETVAAGVDAVRERLDRLRASGHTAAIADAISNDDLRVLAGALRDARLMVGGSGLALGLPAVHGFAVNSGAARLPAAAGARAVVSGSCSTATQAQVARFVADGGPAFAIDPLRVAAGEDAVAAALQWAVPKLGAGPVLVYATAPADSVRDVQQRLGAARAGELVEQTLAAVAVGLVARGVGQLVVAGGETSGAIVQALGVGELRIGPQIDPGVPWCHASAGVSGARGLHLALKSGNFGGPDFFARAFAQLATSAS